ncbi:unnamed protein product, partial [Iphiclides podalirius]
MQRLLKAANAFVSPRVLQVFMGGGNHSPSVGVKQTRPRYKPSSGLATHTCAAMHLILALSVIILQHIDSYSCQSIIRTLDDHQAKSTEDYESYEFKNEDIAELLQPFLQPGPIEKQQLQKNLAKLTIEPYLQHNQMKQQWRRNPYNGLSERKKTIAPLAIILTNLPDLKFKQARDKVVKKTVVIKKEDENKLLSGSEDVGAPSDSPLKTKYDPITSNSENLSSEEIIDIDTSTVVTISSETETGNQNPYSVYWNDSEILNSESSVTPTEMYTQPDDLLSVVDEDTSYFENNERDAKNVRNEETFISNHYTTEGSSSDKANLLEIEEISKDYGLNVRDSANEVKSQSQDYEVENVVIKMLSEEPNASTEENKLNREENLHNQVIKETDKEIFNPIPENTSFRLEIIKGSTETVEHPLIKLNRDHIVVESNEEQSKNHKNENLYESQDQIVIEVDNETIKDAIDNDEKTVDDDKKYPHNFQDQIVIEAEEEPSKENAYENMLISHLKNSYGSQSEFAFNTKENQSSEDAIENSLMMPIRSSHEIHTENESCNHNVHGHQCDMKATTLPGTVDDHAETLGA